MQKNADAATLMLVNNPLVEVHSSSDFNEDALFSASVLSPFSIAVIDLLSTISAKIIRNKLITLYPDVLYFAFWCSRKNLTKLASTYQAGSNRFGRGVIFHIAPSNVPINFAFSMVAGLLAGNVNIIRLPSSNFPQVQIICDAVVEALDMPEHKLLRNQLLLIRYPHNKSITDYLSKKCNVRIIWGGDNAINEIRNSPLSPNSFDITFADRYSICIINSAFYLSYQNKAKIAKDFYNDTYLLDQNACSSPHLIIWVGNDSDTCLAKNVFWSYLHNLLLEKYSLSPINAINKLSDSYFSAINLKDSHLVKAEDNLIIRISIDKLFEGIENFKSSCGFFYEFNAVNISELSSIVNSKYQTITYLGFDYDYFNLFINNFIPKGIDRIVPIGKALDFNLTWDGFDLITSLSRIIHFDAFE